MAARIDAPAELDLLDSLAAPRAARKFVAAWWDDHGLCDETDLGALLLLTSEIVTNAVRHADPPRTLLIEAEPGAVRVTVTDSSSRPPTPVKPAGTLREAGHGLGIVQTLSAAWGHEPTSSGKSVWFTVGCNGPAVGA
jgi:anti-sigma regulatory factor (Ser/Thr protein kinase)